MNDCPLRSLCSSLQPQGFCYPHEHLPFRVVCIDALSCSGIKGARLAVRDGVEELYRAVSDDSGIALVDPLCPGSYTLKAIGMPEGYRENAKPYSLKVSSRGKITVDGMPIEFVRICFYENEV
ncbi:MAG: prealbumin-like fold domain-containing protein [Eubacteriaceae bacterium]|nr:prealbumin-like fold domain-containing protein [Eubacteriaceae bacterium]